MKTTKIPFYASIMAIAFATLAISCKKDKEPDGPSGGGAGASGSLKATVGTANFSSNPSFSKATRISVGTSETITVQGNEDGGKAIILVLNGVDGPATYAIGGGANISISASYIEANAANPAATQTWQAPFDATEAGEVTITTLTSSNIEGSFHFKAKNSSDNSEVEVKEGSFEMEF